MKTKKLFFFKKTLAVLIIAALPFAFAACAKDGIDKRITDNISDLRTDVYTASSDDMSVTVITGRHEQPYAVDGVSGSAKSDYTDISIKPAELPASGQVYQYTLKTGNKTHAGAFTPHPFGVTYYADLAVALSGDAVLTISSGDYKEEFTLQSQRTADMLSWEQALGAGYNAVKKQVGSLYADSKFDGEVYVQFIGDPLQNGGGYFWYVAFVGGGNTYAVLMDPTSGRVLAAKTL